MKLLIGVGMSLISLLFLFNTSEGLLDFILRGVGAILLFIGTSLIFSSKELK